MGFLPAVVFLILLPLLGQAASSLELSSPFLSCGPDTTRKGQCLLLSPSAYASLSSLPVGGTVEFSGFPLPSGSGTAHVALTRFSAAEDLSDLPLAVLLRGRIFRDLAARRRVSSSEAFDLLDGSTVFLGLSPYGSNGFAEFFNSTLLLSTPTPSLEGADPQMDAYVGELARAAQGRLGRAALSFNGGHASVLFETSALSGASSLPLFDSVLPPQEVIDETDRRIAEAQREGGQGKERRTYRVATDADYQLYQIKGYNVDAVASYYYILLGSASSVYARDFGSDLVSSYLRVWNQPDPYPYDGLKALQYMQSTWGPSPSRSMAALISGKNLGGGIAYLRTLCNTAWAYAVNGNMVGYFPTPLQNYNGNNWDIYVFLHEVGHVWGASHTHELPTPADYCGYTPGCGPTAGSIMSYCHLCQNGMSNIYLHFHAYTINEVRPFIGSVAC